MTTPSHNIATRQLTPEEIQVMRRQGGTVGVYGCLLLIFAVGSTGLCILGRRVGDWISPAGQMWGQWIGLAVGVIFLAWIIYGQVIYNLAVRQKLRDIDLVEVEEITVRDPRVVELFLVSDNEPILAMDIGAGKILLLQGPWLRDDPDIYASPGAVVQSSDSDDSREDYFNFLQPPLSFPSTHFLITRSLGVVLKIEPRGVYLPVPSEKVDALKPDYMFGMSEIFDGDLENIAAALKREHEKFFSPPQKRARHA